MWLIWDQSLTLHVVPLAPPGVISQFRALSNAVYGPKTKKNGALEFGYESWKVMDSLEDKSYLTHP